MEYKVLYVLTVRCTEHECAEDLACYKIVDIDEDMVYTTEKNYPRPALMEVETIKLDKEEAILRIPFLIKEAAIVWVREAFVIIHDKCSLQMYEACKEEWRKIMHPKYDTHWFTGGKKVEEWRDEMKSLVKKL